MADQVHARLDDMVPALRDLLNQGIFTEVWKIIIKLNVLYIIETKTKSITKQ